MWDKARGVQRSYDSCVLTDPPTHTYWDKSGMLQRTILQRTNATTKFISIKSGCYNEHRCYNGRGEYYFMLFLCFYYGKFDYSFHEGKIVYAFQIYMNRVQKLNKPILYYFYTYIFYFVLYFSNLNGCVRW